MRKKLLVLFLIFIFSSTLTFADDFDDLEIIDVNAEITASTNTSAEHNIKLPDINSRAYVVIDRNSNIVLCDKNENQVRKMASTTKIMTATIIIENCNLNEMVEISKKAANTGGSRLGLKTGDKISVNDLLYGLMLCSGNDAAVALAEHTGRKYRRFCRFNE